MFLERIVARRRRRWKVSRDPWPPSPSPMDLLQLLYVGSSLLCNWFVRSQVPYCTVSRSFSSSVPVFDVSRSTFRRRASAWSLALFDTSYHHRRRGFLRSPSHVAIFPVVCTSVSIVRSAIPSYTGTRTSAKTRTEKWTRIDNGQELYWNWSEKMYKKCRKKETNECILYISLFRY